MNVAAEGEEAPHEHRDVTKRSRSASCGPARCSRRSASARSSTCRTCRSWSWAWRTGRTTTTGRSARSGSWRRSASILGPQVARPALAARRAGHRTRSNPFDDAVLRRRPGRPVPPVDGLPLLPPAGPARAAACSSLKLDAYRPDQIRYVHANCTQARQAADRRPRPLHRGLQERPPRRLPVGRVRPPGGPTDCTGTGSSSCEVGPSGEAADIYVQCEALRDVPPDVGRLQAPTTSDLPACRGRRPHLRDFDEDGCKDEQDQPMRVEPMLQGASNSWFPILLSALSIPQSSDNLLKQLVERPLERPLETVESEREHRKLRRRQPAAAGFLRVPATPTSGRRSRSGRREARRRRATT